MPLNYFSVMIYFLRENTGVSENCAVSWLVSAIGLNFV